MNRNDEAHQRARLTEGYRYLHSHGLTQQASGNISVRCGDRFLISPSGASATDISPESLVAVDWNGTPLGAGKPSSELPMHLAIYRAKPEAVAVVHTHASACVAIASCRKPIPGFHYLIGSFGGTDIPCADYAVFGSQALADNVVAALQDRQACLMANHGAIAWGKSLDAAILFAHRIEILAQQYLLACQAGMPVILQRSEFEDYWANAKASNYR